MAHSDIHRVGEDHMVPSRRVRADQGDDLDYVVVEHERDEVAGLTQEDGVWRVFSLVHHFGDLSAGNDFQAVAQNVVADQRDIEALRDYEQVVGRLLLLFFLLSHGGVSLLLVDGVDDDLLYVDVPSACPRCSSRRWLLWGLLLGVRLLDWLFQELLGWDLDHVQNLVVELRRQAEVDRRFFQGVHLEHVGAEGDQVALDLIFGKILGRH